ncbi:MAG: hypothetical protein HKUEN07_12870 [Rhodocyclaceae bacterium]|jgi:hypothetical protein|uniref:Uncharacterized protein n=1 Tax=Candidatus Desulfobacillus denitrificans TaxID=2608985 RepID=A0A809QYF5_9PROT|nr:hypothetical protein [Rhodocyclaceae bacterium]MCZ2113686.1 hypothetical protein [Anaerolineae bacterium]OQY71440.1 MAG: hypothetical protein B6D47_06430 [Rhodocyclaceae bacterium UTPRO2]BBO20453.1 conserved hypothetical protein [Candidatus Desulfobacillus denitrificans]GIK44475.1 MAG: hypothetical protein BroJett012_03780 [Betaproteobacteria bacterium]
MSGLTPLEKTGNLFKVTSDIGKGLCALGQVLSAADLERLDDATLSGLGCLLETIGGQLLETSHHGRDIAGVEPS